MGVTVRVSCIERFTGKFQMEVIIPIPLEWGLWSEQGTCVSLFSYLDCTWQRERSNFLIIFSWDFPVTTLHGLVTQYFWQYSVYIYICIYMTILKGGEGGVFIVDQFF